jgi:hypothetical protein
MHEPMPRNSRWIVNARLLLVGLLLLPALGVSQGQIYRHVDEKGNVTFSDQPMPGGEKVEVAPVQTFKPLPGAKAIIERDTVEARRARAEREAARVDAGYAAFTIVSPEQDQALRSNNGNVTVGIAIEPELKPKHYLVYMLDGAPFGERVKSTIQTFENLDRGTHSVQIALVDDAGEEISRTDMVTFHLLRQHK